MHQFKKYTSSIYWWTQKKNTWNPLEKYLKNTQKNTFSVSQTLEIKISPKVHLKYTSYLEYTQKYIWSIATFQQDKILIKVYIIYGTMA